MGQQNIYYRIRQGYKDPFLGDIGGWEVIVIRSFQAEGALYFDAELTEKTISSLSEEKKAEFFSGNYVFTRIRIAQKDTSPSDLREDAGRRQKAFRQVQLQWYHQIGKTEADPTEVESDKEYDGEYDDGRREAMKGLLVLGFVVLMFALSQCDECNKGTGGSWGRSGGGYYA